MPRFFFDVLEHGDVTFDNGGLEFDSAMLPSMRPMRQIARLRKSGIQRRLATVGMVAGARGAKPKMIAAMMATGTAQNTKSHCQLRCSNGSTSGIVSAAGRISPTRRPLV